MNVRNVVKKLAISLAVVVGVALALPVLIGLYFYGPAQLRLLAGPPREAFPNSVGDIDGVGVLTWWGCAKLPSGDAREVGSYDRRALFFVPGGSCEDRNPVLEDTPDHVYLTWRIGLEDEPFGELWLVAANHCPTNVSPRAREEASRLLEEYRSAYQSDNRYRANTEAARLQLTTLLATAPVNANDLDGVVVFPLFPSGLWGPKRRPGGYEVCAPVGPSN